MLFRSAPPCFFVIMIMCNNVTAQCQAFSYGPILSVCEEKKAPAPSGWGILFWASRRWPCQGRRPLSRWRFRGSSVSGGRMLPAPPLRRLRYHKILDFQQINLKSRGLASRILSCNRNLFHLELVIHDCRWSVPAI